MANRFAIMKYMEEEKFEQKLKFTPKILHEWYAKKFISYEISDLSLGKEQGFAIELSISYKKYQENPEKHKIIIDNIIEKMKTMDIKIILFEKNKDYEFSKYMRYAENKNIFIFFMDKAIKKALKDIKKDIKKAEILIIGDNEGMTLSILDTIHSELNFLYIMTDNPENEMFMEKSREIFEDCGLNIMICEKNKSIVENADVIINTSCEINKFSYFFKKDVVYLDLGGNKENTTEIAIKRKDIILADTLKINFGEKKILINTFELFYFCYSNRYRSFLARGYNPKLVSEIYKDINKLDTGIPILTLYNP